MNNTATQIIKRQLLIIQFFLANNYVSTLDIQDYLKEKDFDIPLRTLQRDLTTLSEILPIECRKEDKPYSWRWQRLANTSCHGLSMSQALALRIVETELKGVIPKDLYERLTPLFIKAQFIKGLAEIEMSEFDWSNDGDKHEDRFSGTHGFRNFVPQSSVKSFINHLTALTKNKSPIDSTITGKNEHIKEFIKKKIPIFDSSTKLNTTKQKDIIELANELNKKQLGFLAELLQQD
ncbi:hypothetical protein I6J32_10745 [Moraxella osloensis]|nr:hypothetical protein [Moraxella osloensis]QRO13054.1 hypothetical protein I6J32_10745 [Moraxella osloensis]